MVKVEGKVRGQGEEGKGYESGFSIGSVAVLLFLQVTTPQRKLIFIVLTAGLLKLDTLTRPVAPRFCLYSGASLLTGCEKESSSFLLPPTANTCQPAIALSSLCFWISPP